MTNTELKQEYDNIYKRCKNISSKREVERTSSATLKSDASETMKIFNWIAPIRIGDTTVISAKPGCGKSFMLNEIIKSYEEFDEFLYYAVGEDFRSEDRVKSSEMDPRVHLISDSDPDGADEDSIDCINEFIDYIDDCINDGNQVLVCIDSLTGIINSIGKEIPSNSGMGAGGYTTQCFKLARRLFSLAGKYPSGATVTIVATALALDKNSQIIIDFLDSISGSIIPLETRGVTHGSCPAFDFKGTFSYREKSDNISLRWKTLASDFKSRPSEFICSKIKERM